MRTPRRTTTRGALPPPRGLRIVGGDGLVGSTDERERQRDGETGSVAPHRAVHQRRPRRPGHRPQRGQHGIRSQRQEQEVGVRPVVGRLGAEVVPAQPRHGGVEHVGVRIDFLQEVRVLVVNDLRSSTNGDGDAAHSYDVRRSTTSVSPEAIIARRECAERPVWFSERHSRPGWILPPSAVGVPPRSRRFDIPSIRSPMSASLGVMPVPNGTR